MNTEEIAIKIRSEANKLSDAERINLYRQGMEIVNKRPASDGWQPIETAPMDGTHILVIGTNGIHRIAQRGHGDRIGKTDGFYSIRGGYLIAETPTHWMALPEPPK